MQYCNDARCIVTMNYCCTLLIAIAILYSSLASSKLLKENQPHPGTPIIPCIYVLMSGNVLHNVLLCAYEIFDVRISRGIFRFRPLKPF